MLQKMELRKVDKHMMRETADSVQEADDGDNE